MTTRTATVAAAGSLLAFTIGGPVLLARAGAPAPVVYVSIGGFLVAWLLIGTALADRARKRRQAADTTTYEQPGRAA